MDVFLPKYLSWSRKYDDLAFLNSDPANFSINRILIWIFSVAYRCTKLANCSNVRMTSFYKTAKTRNLVFLRELPEIRILALFFLFLMLPMF
jgi:hypothetical protein